MARLLSIRPKGVYVSLEFNLEDIKKLSAILGRATVSPTTPEEMAGADYLEETFEPLLKSIIEECE